MSIDAALLRSIRLICFDFDGVFTDNRVWTTEDGRESVVCNRSDGLGLEKIRRLKVPMAILSTERNPVVQMRAQKLQLECLSGCQDKLASLKSLALRHNVNLDQIAFVGNDINDVECLKAVALPTVVADAFPEAKAQARWTLACKGGEGAVREFCDAIHAAHFIVEQGKETSL